ncbi:MAG: universal stress protein [Prolixibacteraceae bacterium]
MKNILLGVDLNEQTDILVQKAQDLARKYGAKLWLLHVIAPLPEYIGFDVSFQFAHSGYDEVRKSQKVRLDQYVEKVKKEGVDAEGIVMEGVATSVIIDESKELEVDLIICGHHEHNILYHMLFGSTSTAVVRNSEIPVLVYPLK